MTSVALVDDHELLRSGLAGLINSFPEFEVVFEAGNGKEFIEKVDMQHPPEIVLLDITMPVMDGYETALWIKNKLPDTKVLVLSMLSNDMAIIRMLRNGVKGYILKESKPEVFKQALDSVKNNDFYVNELVRNKLINYVTNEEGTAENTSMLLNITEGEAQFLRWLCMDKSYKEIAQEMFVSV
ncbi:MAG: response regulator transcription factor, partial [Sediminibacterium sp.]|nr:response regulator transcription factor [Sediminibacterium sp.]